jgi:hypothetical protein
VVFLSSDYLLARRIEAAEAINMFGLAAGASGDVHSERIAGGVAVCAGAGSPISHAAGIGMDGPVTVEEFVRLEQFFHSRGCACVLDLCPLADFSVIEQVMQRAYKIVELNNVLVRRVLPEDSELETLLPIPEDRKPEWVRTVACGFAGSDDPPPEFESLLSMSWRETSCFLASGSGAAMGIAENTALFYGDATVMRERGKGGQSRLIKARLAHAARMGCDLAVATVLPGSGSHRNYERAGFQLVYMRVNVSR